MNTEAKRAQNRRWKANHPEAVRAQWLRHDAKHREERRLAAAKRRAEDPAGNKAIVARYLASHRKEVCARNMAFRAANPGYAPNYNAEYRLTHLEEERQRNRQWRKNNPERSKAKLKRRRARKAAAVINDLTAEQWQNIKAAYGYRCVYCHRKMRRLTQDHITPLSKGGNHTMSNVVPACRSCNSKKGVNGPLTPVQPLLLTGGA